MLQFGHAFANDEHRPFKLTGTKNVAFLLVHGFPGTPAEMRSVGDALHAQGWTVYAPLLPGFGEDIDTLPQRTHHDWLAHLENAYRELLNDYENIILVGLSMGGALSVQIASKYQPKGLILLAPFWKIQHILWQSLPLIKHVIPNFKPFRIFNPNFGDPATRASILRFLPDANLDDPTVQTSIRNFAIPVAMIDQIRIAGEVGYKLAKSITCPTLIIQGRQDELVVPSVTRQYLQEFTNAPQYVELAGTHTLTDENLPSWESVVTTILTFSQTITG